MEFYDLLFNTFEQVTFKNVSCPGISIIQHIRLLYMRNLSDLGSKILVQTAPCSPKWPWAAPENPHLTSNYIGYRRIYRLHAH